MRLIHSADWQIGKVFRFAGDDVMALLQRARLDAIKTLGRLAKEHDAANVLVAGDVYDKEGLADRTLAQPLELMRDFPEIAWHLIPGNHDPDRPNGVWQRLLAMDVPANVHVHLEPAPVALDRRTSLLPAPLRHHHTVGDPTEWMDDANTPADHRRIGLAHGSVAAFGTSAATPNLIAPDRAKKAGLAYLALGDWHGTRKIGARCWYAGTPEPDRFDRPDSGQALLVDIDGGEPTVTPLATGRYRWLIEHATLHDRDDIRRLGEALREKYQDLSSVLLDLTVDGMLSLGDHAAFQREIEISLDAALCYLRTGAEALILKPSPDDLAALARDRVIRDAVQRLQAIAGDAGHADRTAANRALQHLYLACHKRQKGVAA